LKRRIKEEKKLVDATIFDSNITKKLDEALANKNKSLDSLSSSELEEVYNKVFPK
jgi:hypothetical protein